MSVSPAIKQLAKVSLAGGTTPVSWVFKTGSERLFLMVDTLVLGARRRIPTWCQAATWGWVGVLLAAPQRSAPRLTTFSLLGCFAGKAPKGCPGQLL